MERTRDHINSVEKVYPDLVPLSEESVFEKLCVRSQLASFFTPLLEKLLEDQLFRSFLLSCSLAPRALAVSIRHS